MRKLFICLIFLALVNASASADSVGVRGSVTDYNTDEDPDVYEVFFIRDLPRAWTRAAYQIQTQVEITGGVLDGAGETGFLGTVVPGLKFHNNRFLFDLGGGLALLSEDEFGELDFGGSPQFVAQAGVGLALTKRVKAGLRVRHMSDAGTHDGDTMNVFLVELRYDLE